MQSTKLIEKQEQKTIMKINIFLNLERKEWRERERKRKRKRKRK
jgi:hypothetical protein